MFEECCEDIFRVDTASVNWVGQELWSSERISSSVRCVVWVIVLSNQTSSVHGENNFNTSQINLIVDNKENQ